MNDYRIGNLVNDNYMVIEIDANGLGLVDANLPDDLASYIYVEYENIKPIPLTEKWQNKTYFAISITENISIWTHKEKVLIEQYSEGVEEIKDIIYVHQRQNLYFTFTGLELIQ